MINLDTLLAKFTIPKSVVTNRKNDGKYNRIRVIEDKREPISGVYIFWWIGKTEILTNGNIKIIIKGKEVKKEFEVFYSKQNCIDFIEHKGKKFIKYTHEFSIDKDIYEKFGRIPLYVGKTTNLDNRIQQHLMNGKIEYGEIQNENGTIRKANTVCQLRSHLEYLLRKTSDGIEREEKESYELGLSNVKMQYFKNHICKFDERFYLENELIGRLKPWFNIDSER